MLPIYWAMWKPEFWQACLRSQESQEPSERSQPSPAWSLNLQALPRLAWEETPLSWGQFQLQESGILFFLLHYLW